MQNTSQLRGVSPQPHSSHFLMERVRVRVKFVILTTLSVILSPEN